MDSRREIYSFKGWGSYLGWMMAAACIVWKPVLRYTLPASCCRTLYLNMVTGTVGERDSNELNMAESLNKRKSNHPGFQGREFELKKKIWAVFQYCWLILFTGLPTKYVVILTFSALVTVKMFLSFPNHLINNFKPRKQNSSFKFLYF